MKKDAPTPCTYLHLRCTYGTHGIKSSMLGNEKYKGDALLQKAYTVDFLTKKKAVNKGEVPQYYVENHHPAIVTREQWALAQNELARRSRVGKQYSGSGIFSSKIICGECGCRYGSKVWHSNDKYRKVIWRCNGKYRKAEKCKTPHLSEDEIKAAFVKAYNILVSDGKGVLEDLASLKEMKTDTAELDARLEAVSMELESLVTQTENLIAENASRAQNQDEYKAKYDALAERYDENKEEYDGLVEQIEAAKAAGAAIDDFIKVFKAHGTAIAEFDDELWGCMVENVTVSTDGSMKFFFKSGYEVTVE